MIRTAHLIPQMNAAVLMIQGTTSNAGKSVLATGLCRLFSQHGYKVAPFKPQNMALNSAVTIDGGEIGRSQAVQAMAAGVEPTTDMNPILLKPNSDKGAQLILNGHPHSNMDAVSYHEFKKEAFQYAIAAYHRLAREFDIVIVEGAGSPAEINLREHDIANMGFALAADCPVLLCADIDRGGVFAHLTGTLDCLDSAERNLIKGFVINRFRGDKDLLTSGIDWLEAKTGIPTLGVLPYLKGLHIEAEDAVDQRSTRSEGELGGLKVLVPRIPRISNHTDFDVLRLHPNVDLHFIEENTEIPPADLVVLPGSKNTVSDLEWMLRNGWDQYLLRHLRYGGKLIGICGGYQMIGQTIHDPLGIEGPAGSTPALGLMNFSTTLQPSKQLTRIQGRFVTLDAEVTGYEIHMGETVGPDLERPAINLPGRSDGVISADNQILCTYLHGVFDHSEACAALLKWAGLESSWSADYDALRHREFDRVARMLDEEIGFNVLADCAGLKL